MNAARRLFILVGVVAASCSNWPPVVSHGKDVDGLPADQREIRCIACDDETLAAVGRRFQNLDYLYISTQSKITDHGIAALSRLSRLRQLEVTSASLLTDASIAVLKQLPSLRELSLDGAIMISDKALMSLTSGSKLERLYLLHFPNISSETIQKMREQLP